MTMAFRIAFSFVLAAAISAAESADRILIFTKTAGVRENNIADNRKALKEFYEGKGLMVDTSENGGLFSDTGLARYRAVVFFKTTGDILTDAQQAAFEKWFQAGGAAQIIHASLNTETAWPFYGKLIGGAWFKSLPGDSNTTHTIVVEDSTDASTRGLPRRWARKDEVYDFRANPRAARDPAMHILVTVDESTYRNGTAGTDHPMSWYCSYLGGRAWITAMGHVTVAYSDPLFLGHLWGGMEFLLGRPTVAVAAGPRQARAVGAKRGIIRSGVRFGTRLEKDARGREPDLRRQNP